MYATYIFVPNSKSMPLTTEEFPPVKTILAGVPGCHYKFIEISISTLLTRVPDFSVT